MPKTKEQKKETLKDIKDKIDRQKSMVFAGIKGLKAKDLFDLRETLKKADCLLNVAKKTLISLALKEKKVKVNIKKLEGETALVFGFKDEIAAAKISRQFSLKNENLKILGGIFDNRFIDEKEVISLASLSSKEELYSKVVRTIQAPIANLVGVFSGNLRSLVFVLNSIHPLKSDNVG